ncbi:inositol polyphosphate-4-phosphatase type I A isoform X2 [Nematostella vectensis]|nr:inositol polyphosphate-4-phosphatase type I A isoform X2 [Nematostella vectensis]
MCIACNGLISPIPDRLPNAFVEIRTMTPPSVSWSKHAQTEIIEQKSDPYFLTTVVFPSNGTIQDVTRLKLAVFDVRDRDKEEMILLGHSMCTIRDIVSSPDKKLVLSLTSLDTSVPCGTVTLLGWQVEPVKPRTESQLSIDGDDTPQGRRNSGKAMVLVDQILTRSYRFPTRTPGKILKVVELMGESMLSFKIPIQLLKIYIAEEQQRILELHHLGDLNPDWEAYRQEIIDNHFKLICNYKGDLRDLMPLQVGNNFKASRLRGNKKLATIPVNLHIQRMRVNDGSGEGKVYDISTVGAFTAHTLKFGQGGLRRMTAMLKKSQQSGSEGENRAAQVKKSRANLEKLKVTITHLCQKLKTGIKTANVSNILDTQSSLSDKANHLLILREASIVKESLATLKKSVPKPDDPHQGGDSTADGQWNVTAFSNDEAQELSKLVEQCLLLIQAHVNSMIQGTQPPENTSWTDAITSEIHDFSRAVEGLSKEIYLALIFAQLQEDSKHIPLLYAIKRRQDIVFAHAVTSLIAGFVSKLYTDLSNPLFWKQIVQIGFLVHFESLLSTSGDEMGMLEDMCVGVRCLTNVKFKIKKSDRDDEIPALSGNRSFIQVSIPVHVDSFQLLPRLVQQGQLIKVTPVLFTQGINEQATLAERFGDTTLQESINGDNYSILNFYFQQFKEKFPESAESPRPESMSLASLMEQLKASVESKKSKNVDIFAISEEICWRMNGARFTSCKSAKDRTAMAVTLEQAVILKHEHDMDPEFFQQALDAMRSEGTRRENTYKNAGIRRYAFNYWQVKALPNLYRPPEGTYGKNVQT